jgi:hypothetical protein
MKSAQASRYVRESRGCFWKHYTHCEKGHLHIGLPLKVESPRKEVVQATGSIAMKRIMENDKDSHLLRRYEKEGLMHCRTIYGQVSCSDP